MKKLTALCIVVFALVFASRAQVTCTNASHSTLTNYTNGQPNDSLFFICNGQTATLLAMPPSGVPGWDFEWQQFNVPGNAWVNLTSVAGVPVSTQNNLQPGGYRVIITDGTAAVVGTYIVWVCRININPTVNVQPIAAGCGNVQLSGQINAGSITPYYNAPLTVTDPNSSLLITAETAITVCFSGTHSWISDLGFYLVGPADCGSPTILLSPNPGSNGQNFICNGADNFTNLCFTTESTAIFNPCAPGTYSGTYGGYGPGAGTLIDWSALNGCDASQAGWSVQVYDCVAGDLGALTSASINVNGTSVGGAPITYTYSSPSGFSSPIADNSCASSSASIFTVPASPASIITFPTAYQWTANPPFTIPNSSSSLNILLNPGPTVDTQFTLSLIGSHPGAVCAGTSTDTELFDYLTPGTAVINPVATSYCTLDEAFNLTSDTPGGSWSGTGITSSAAGTFNPATAGEGVHTITYSLPGNCIAPGTITIEVLDEPLVSIQSATPLCNTAESITLTATPSGGTWSGTGITNASTGTFDPSIAGPGSHSVLYTLSGSCSGEGSTTIEVTQFIQPSITAPTALCVEEADVALSASPSGGVWSGTGVNSSGVFSPSAAGIGIYSITYSVAGNCEQVVEATINVAGESVVNIQPVIPMCTNSSIINLNAGMAGGNWSGPGITNANAGTFNPSAAGAGTHTINYLNEVGVCPAAGSIEIVVNEFQQPVIANQDPLCVSAAPVTLSASPAGGNWSGSGVDANGVFNPTASGVGNASITYSVGGTCPGTATTTVVVNPMPVVNVSNDISICNGASTILSVSGADSFSWSPSTGLSSSVVASPTASPSTTTVYTVTGTTNGCAMAEQVVVTVYPATNVLLNGPIVICEGDTAQLSMTGLTNFNWNNTATLIGATTATPLAFPNNTTMYTATGTDANGCAGSGSVEVVVVEPAFIYSPEQGMAPLSVDFINQSSGSQFLWDFGNGETITNSDASVVLNSIYEEEGLFIVTLTVVDGGISCSVSHSVLVYDDSSIVILPNIVTDDGNGKNDTFTISTTGMRTMDVQIFDSWGKNIGSIDTPSGNWSPREHPTGTYYFTLKAEGIDGKKFDKGGYFTVVR